MSLEYVERKIVEAIKLSKGNTARARQQVIAWALEDHELLQYLTKSHLSGIVAYNIERVMSGRAAAARIAEKTKPAAGKASAPKKEADFGVELLKAVASSSSEIFGFEHSPPLGRRGQASQSHVNAIRAIATKQKKS